jgi:hypothetical protein
MAKGVKTGGKDFAEGNPGGPGRPPISPEIKILRKLTVEKLEEIADLILAGDRPTLQLLANSHTEPAIRVAYARAALNAMQKGDLQTIEMILARLVGKVKEKVEHSGKVTLEDLVAGAHDSGSAED